MLSVILQVSQWKHALCQNWGQRQREDTRQTPGFRKGARAPGRSSPSGDWNTDTPEVSRGHLRSQALAADDTTLPPLSHWSYPVGEKGRHKVEWGRGQLQQ